MYPKNEKVKKKNKLSEHITNNFSYCQHEIAKASTLFFARKDEILQSTSVSKHENQRIPKSIYQFPFDVSTNWEFCCFKYTKKEQKKKINRVYVNDYA